MNLFIVASNIASTNALISFLMLSTFSFLTHKMTWAWIEPWCCSSYWITYFWTLPITPFFERTYFYINCSNLLWNIVAHSIRQSFHVIWTSMFLINLCNWSILADLNGDIWLDVKVRKKKWNSNFCYHC